MRVPGPDRTRGRWHRVGNYRRHRGPPARPPNGSPTSSPDTEVSPSGLPHSRLSSIGVPRRDQPRSGKRERRKGRGKDYDLTRPGDRDSESPGFTRALVDITHGGARNRCPEGELHTNTDAGKGTALRKEGAPNQVEEVRDRRRPRVEGTAPGRPLWRSLVDVRDEDGPTTEREGPPRGRRSKEWVGREAKRDRGLHPDWLEGKRRSQGPEVPSRGVGRRIVRPRGTVRVWTPVDREDTRLMVRGRGPR